MSLSALTAPGAAREVQPPLATPSASSSTAATVGSAPPPGVPVATTASPLSSQPLAANVANAAGLQDASAPLLADLSAALERSDLPPDVRATAVQVLGGELATDPAPDAAGLSAAVARSGLFLEADLAQGLTPADNDAKAALLDLSASLSANGASGRGTASGAPPPYAGSALQAQAAQDTTLSPNAALDVVLDQLARRTTAALSRQLLLQAGSVRTTAASSRQAPAHWLFELPLATPEGCAVAPFQIDRDGAQTAGEEDQPVWRARFSLDVGQIGPVHAKLSLQGDRVRVALWAEDSATVQDLDGRRDELMAALREQAFEPQLLVQSGAPETPAAPAGGLVDKAI